MSSASKYTPGSDDGGSLTDRSTAAAPVDAEQVEVQMQSEGTQDGSTVAASPSPAPTAAAASSSSSSSSSPPVRPPSASMSGARPPAHQASNLLSTLQTQITPACHVTQPDGNPGSAGNVFVHVIESE